MWCIYFSMTDIKYEKPLIITNMQIFITKIWFWSSQGRKIRCNVLIGTSVLKPIDSTSWRDITQCQICARLLSIALVLKLRAAKSCMVECLAQLAAWILPPAALPITLYVVTGERVVEAAEIWSGRYRSVCSVAKLVRTLTSMEITPIATKVSKKLALRDKGWRRCVWRGQQRSINNNRPHVWIWWFVNKFMR